MADTSTTTFDYTTLPAIDRITVRDCTEEVHGFIHRTGRDAHRIGRKLTAVKTLLGHGRFLAWLRAEFNWSVDTAERLMKVAERFPEIPHRAEIGQSALYVLTGKGVPEEARREALARAGAGEAITKSVARTIVGKHRGPRNGTGKEGRAGAAPAGGADTTGAGVVSKKMSLGAKAASGVSVSDTAAGAAAGSDESPVAGADLPAGTPDAVYIPAVPPSADANTGDTPTGAKPQAQDDFDLLLMALWPPTGGPDVGAVVRRVARGWPAPRRAELARRVGEFSRALTTASEVLAGGSRPARKSNAGGADRGHA